MKQLLIVCALLAAATAHASVVGASHGNHSGAGLGPAGGQAAAGQAAKSGVSNASASGGGVAQAGGNGGRYSMADNYQPWPQSEMQQFAKPAFVTYTGK